MEKKPGDLNEEGKEIEQDGDVTWEKMQVCINCGIAFPQSKGKSYNIGRRQEWLCQACSKYGSWQTDNRSFQRMNQIRRKNEKDK